MKISQSLINDIFIGKSDQLKDTISPKYCPAYLKYKYVEKMDTKPTDAQLYGKYFEWHLLGKTRDGIEPIIPRVGIKNLKPTKSASKGDMQGYLIKKGVYFKDTDKNADLYKLIEALPEDKSAGEPSTQQKTLDVLIQLCKSLLNEMGLPVDKGEKQVCLESKGKIGHIDWITDDFMSKKGKCIIDVKFTKTAEDDWRNGWANIEEKEEAKIQAAHYTELYKEVYGTYVPFYFFIFGETGWVKIIRMRFTAEGMSMYTVSFNHANAMTKQYIKEDWPARPSYNRCLKCDFNEICPNRALLPDVSEYVY